MKNKLDKTKGILATLEVSKIKYREKIDNNTDNNNNKSISELWRQLQGRKGIFEGLIPQILPKLTKTINQQ